MEKRKIGERLLKRSSPYRTGPPGIPRHGSQRGRRSARLVGLALVLVLLLAIPCSAAHWQSLYTTSDGIQIFKNDAGKGGLIAFRGIGIVNAPLPRVATVIFDTRRRREWIKGLAESRILRWEGKDRFIEYDHVAMPIFFSDRDFVSQIRMHFDRSRNELIFHYQPADDPAAPHTSYLRGEMIDMTFLLSPLAHGTQTRVDARFLCDPKGWIPDWLDNFFLRDWPKVTFRNLRTEVRKPDISVAPHIFDLLHSDPANGN